MEKVKKISITFVTMLLALVVVGLCPFMSMKVEAAVNLNASIYSDGQFHEYTGPELEYCNVKFVDGVLTIVPTGNGAAKINSSAFKYGDYRPYESSWEPNAEQKLIKKLVIDGNIEIKDEAFGNNLVLENVTLKGATINGAGVFCQCIILEEAYMSDDVKVVSSSQTFQGCIKLKTVRLPKDIVELDSLTFGDCASLMEIELPQKIEIIKRSTFSGCTSLKSITFPTSLTELKDIFDYFNAKDNRVNMVKPNELIFLGNVPTIDTQFKNWLKDPDVLVSLEQIVVPDEYYDHYMEWFDTFDDTDVKDRVKALLKKYSEAFPNGRDEDGDGDNDHEGGSNDDESRPAPPTPNQMAQELILRLLEEQIAAMDSSSNRQATIDGNELVNGLPNATMKKIADTPNAVVFFKYIYDGVHYTTAIPTDAVFDTSVDWYGPLYMMNVFPTMQDTATGAVPYIPVAAPIK